MKEMFKFANKMLVFVNEMAELKYSNKWMKNELSNSVNKQDIIDCMFISDNGIFIKSDCDDKLKRLLGVDNESNK